LTVDKASLKTHYLCCMHSNHDQWCDYHNPSWQK